jgi:hypothetical protein
MRDLLWPHGEGSALESHELVQVRELIIIAQLWCSDHVVINEVQHGSCAIY